MYGITLTKTSTCCHTVGAQVAKSIINAFMSKQVNPSTLNILDSIALHSRYKFVLKWRRKLQGRYEMLTIPDKRIYFRANLTG